MHKKLVNADSHSPSVQALELLYADHRIPAEKKPFLISLRDSTGPLMAVAGGDAILDVASQIASLALGFNPGVAFGTAQLLESWTGRTDTATLGTLRRAFSDLLARQLGWRQVRMHLCHSGAEANETALGMCYQDRQHRDARQVIAFRNSFHGRMMTTLAATWNPAKREPFAWPGCETSFVDYPEMPEGDDVNEPPIPAGWQAIWAAAPRCDFVERIQAEVDSGDALLDREVNSLLQLRELLKSGRHYAVIIEPMQCEGGDRYSSARFHHALVNLCRGYRIPLVYDEIQTGFGLGGDFFWHTKFDLRDSRGRRVEPDYVVIAKKAQVGAVLSPHDGTFPQEQYNAASLVRGFIQASMIDQFRLEIDAIQERSRTEIQNLMQRYAPQIGRPRVSGLSFAFDFADPETLKRFVARRFHHGLLYYPAGDRAARFRFNLSFRGKWLDLAWSQIHAALADTLATDPGSPPAAETDVSASAPDSYFDFHGQFLGQKLAAVQGIEWSGPDAGQFIQSALVRAGYQDLEMVFLDARSYPEYRDRIAAMQKEIYEPLRQTAIEKFDRLIEANNSLALVVCQADRIVAMAFAAPPANFPGERGLRRDELYFDPQTVYMLDLTVIPQFRGQLGRIMKQGLCLLAQQQGLSAVIGRNRDRLARGMWAINLSLGSYCTRRILEDYMDQHEHRDCLMYRCDLKWDVPPADLSGAVDQPLTCHDLTHEFCAENMPSLVNKLTLSNFVTPDYLDNLATVFSLLPDSLQHGYSASGISECVDKLVKALWLKRKPRTRLVTLRDSYFGTGSFMARALTGSADSWISVDQLPRDDRDQLIQQLDQALASDEVLAVFVEPLGWKSGLRIPLEWLLDMQEVCDRYGVPLVSHDSGGLMYRYSADQFGPAGTGGFQPDAGLMSLGGQMALCFLQESWFVDTPLMFISTWDGDAFSLAQFTEMARRTCADRTGHEALVNDFHQLLTTKLAENDVTDYDLFRGTGWFSGPVETGVADMFRPDGRGRRVCLASPGAMRQFVESVRRQTAAGQIASP